MRPTGIRRLCVLLAGVAASATVATLLAVPASAGAPPEGYQLPFRCGETWVGATRRNHSPAPRAVDFNRPDDRGAHVVAAAAGTVTRAYPAPHGGYGRWIVVDHGTESSLYAHLDLVMVRVGQVVDAGELLGIVGASGNTSGSHLHFERHRGDRVARAWFAGIWLPWRTPVASENCVDVPLAGDLLGDGIADPVVFRRGERGSFRVQRPGETDLVLRMGRSSDEPLLGDWDGDGDLDPGVRRGDRPRFWLRTPAGSTWIRYGTRQDVPVAGDWDGDGRWEVGVYRPHRGVFRLRTAEGTARILLGGPGTVPVTGDWDGDGITDVGVHDPGTATWTLRETATGVASSIVFGTPGDLPVTGDWDGDGSTGIGTWHPDTAEFLQLRADRPTSHAWRVEVRRFGNPRR